MAHFKLNWLSGASTIILGVIALLTACHSADPPRYTVSGTVSGLAAGQSVILNDGGDGNADNSFGTVTVPTNGAFSFLVSIPANSSFNVSIAKQPTGQSCSISNGTGASVTSDVSNVSIRCTATSFNLSGTITGLASGSEVLIQNNASDALKISSDGSFTFSTRVSYNGSYAVTVQAQPVGETCTVSNGVGTGVTADISNVTVACATDTYTIGGNVSGLPNGTQVALQNNASDTTTVTQNGAFKFSTPAAFNGSYAVTIASQPTGDTCSVSHGTGAGVTADIANVAVTCSPTTFSIGGSLTGLSSGSQVTLYNNAGDPLTVTANGAFTFSTRVVFHGSYSVTVGTQPVGATCTVANGSAAELNSNVTNVNVACSTNTYTIGGTLTGLAGGAQVTLLNNGTDPRTLTANGSFTFNTPVVYGGAYAVTVGTRPNGQYCGVTNAAGTSVSANVVNVSIDCADNPVNFANPGTYTWSVPEGVSSIELVVTGGGGGGGGMFGNSAGLRGGAGAVVTSTLTVTAGQVLNLIVGGGGVHGADGPVVGNGFYCGAGGGGGGASSVDAGSTDQIVAGGGGGGSSCRSGTGGGNGGGPNGAGGDGSSGIMTTGGTGGSSGVGGAGGSVFNTVQGQTGGSGSGGAGGNGGSNGGGSIPGGAGGSGVGAGSGGGVAISIAGGGGGGYGGGGGGYQLSSGGAGGSIGPTGTTYAPGTNGGASSTSGGDGSIVITIP